MSVYRYAATLLDVSTPVNTAVEGDEYVVIPDDTDSAADHQQTFKAFLHATQDGGTTSPTTDVSLQTSADGENWVTVAGTTQLTGDGGVDELDSIAGLGRYVRAVTALGGAANPNHTAKVVLVSDAPFRLVAAD